MKFLSKALYLILLSALAISCVTKPHVVVEYQELIKSREDSTSGRTVIVFLVDGLPLSTLRDGVNHQRLPNINKYFLSHKNQIHAAHAVFPSLTFPGIGSLLTERPVDQHGVYGNVIFYDEEKLEFESPLSFGTLNKIVSGQNIYARLKAKGLKAVSIAYTFNGDAASRMELRDVDAYHALQNKNYAFVDSQLIGSLESMLEDNKAQQWPDFIFVHLIGIDLTSHDQGSKSFAVSKYLEFLDEKLGPVFKTLEKMEKSKQRRIMTLLTADHGFDQNISRTLSLEQYLAGVDPRIKVLNEGRVLGLYFPIGWQSDRSSALMRDLISQPDIDIIAHQVGDKVFVQSHALQATLSYGPRVCPESTFSISVSGSGYSCPENLSATLNQLYYPFFISNLSHYFHTPGHPDAVVIAKTGVAFQTSNKAMHGGPTPEEVFVPLLMRNCGLSDPQKIPALWELLQFM